MQIQSRGGVPQCNWEHYLRTSAGRRLLHEAPAWWAERKPHDPAIIFHECGRVVDWLSFDQASTDLALQLLRMGFSKGDFLAASMPMSLEHIFLEYACFKIGVIHAPLDLRLRAAEVLRCLEMLRPKGFVSQAGELIATVRREGPSMERLFASQDLAEMVARGPGRVSDSLRAAFQEAGAAIGVHDGAQVIFTTGSTGSPKPALLSHQNITSQNLCLGAAFGFGDERILLNLPPSHVGGQAEVLMTALFVGGTVVVLESFDPARSLEAIERHRVTLLGQVPAMFQFEWRLGDFGRYDLSSLRKVVYGGQQVSRQFLERMARMAPLIATGLGLTETSGFCTYTPMTSSIDEMEAGIGFDMPLYPLSIRREINRDGTAGAPLPDGEVGNICFKGPQTFLGYVSDPVATARTISSDGVLYTGDLGWKDDRGLHFSARAKWVIKPAGFQVFPGDVEKHVCALQEKVVACGAVGAGHRLLSEAIVAFVEKRPGAELSIAELRRHARTTASYMRPLHYVILDPGQIPLNRAAKIDYLRLSEMARQEVERLRAQGRWDNEK